MQTLFVTLITLILLLFPHANAGDIYDSAKFQLNGSITDYYSNNPNLERYVKSILKDMSDEELAGQVLMPAWGKDISKKTVENWICKNKVGGFMILRDRVSKKSINDLKEKAKDCGRKTPLFISIDAEPTLIHNGSRVKGLKGIRASSSLKDAQAVNETADKIHSYLISLGLNMNFAPVVDNNKNKTVIGNRSFGGSTKNIQELASVFIQNAIRHNIIPSIKHFPGHGEARGDTHHTLESVPGTLKELQNFLPVKHSWESPMIMVGHLIIKGGKYDSSGLPSTLSKTAMTDLLRKKLKFQGLVITDAMNMGAVSKFKNTSVRALEAGADIVLMPKNTSRAHSQILKKMHEDANFKKHIIESARRIIKLKVVQIW